MRDPSGRLRFTSDHVLRSLSSAPADAVGFLNSATARDLVEDGMLWPFELRNDLSARRLRFVSYPHEWCDAQFHAAGQLTLDIGERLLSQGLELKDASAWNVIFEGTQPRYCDHLSFQTIARPQWWAFGQFCRHFIFPLALSRQRGLHAHQALLVQRDGVDAGLVRRMLGWRGMTSRLLPLLLPPAEQVSTGRPANEAAPTRPVHSQIYAYSRFCLRPHRTRHHNTGPWADYVQDRGHYSGDAMSAKLAAVDRWLERCEPTWVTDFGCNTGEFSGIAARHKAHVVAIDADHDSIDRLFGMHQSQTLIHPVIANLGDLCGGRGWWANEFAGLPDRLVGLSDVVMMLALIHHLAIGESIPMDEVAALAARTTRRFAIVETMAPNDPMVRGLLDQRSRDASDFSVERQIAAFDAQFQTLEVLQLPGTARQLRLLEKRP
jgi:SAM-dependent methyltransferase